MLNRQNISKAGFKLWRGGNCISFLSKDGLVDIEGKYSWGAGIAELEEVAGGEGMAFGCEGGGLVGEANFSGGVEGEVIAVLFLVEVLFEVVVIEFAFLVPVTQFGFGGESTCNVVVVHLPEVIFLFLLSFPYGMIMILIQMGCMDGY